MNFSKEARKNSVKYMMNGIKYVCQTFGGRNPGSEGEHKAQEYMASELAKYSDEVKIEDFKLHPDSFFGWIPIMVTLSLIGLVTYFFMPLVSAVMIVLAFIPMLLQFVFYTKAFDPLFKEETSCNVTAIKKPKGEVKRRIVFNGHADAVHEWRLNYNFGGKVYIATFVLCMIGIVYVLGISILS